MADAAQFVGSPWWSVALWVSALWVGALLFQLADVGTAWFDLRNTQTGPGRLTRRRAHELFWVPPVAALVAFSLAFAIDFAVSLVLDAGWVLGAGVLVALTVVVLVVGGTVVGTVALLTRDVQSYSLLHYRLADVRGARVSKSDVAEWRAQLAAIDERESVRHEPVARLLRLIPIVLAVASAAIWAIAVAVSRPDGNGAFGLWGLVVVIAVGVPATSIVLASRAARLSLRARASWALVNGRHRSAVVTMIEESERKTNRGVAGLSDRVARALQILRDQQL